MRDCVVNHDVDNADEAFNAALGKQTVATKAGRTLVARRHRLRRVIISAVARAAAVLATDTAELGNTGDPRVVRRVGLLVAATASTTVTF